MIRSMVVTHEMSRTGAPRVAIDLADALATLGPTTGIARWGGPLLDEFRAAVDVMFFEPGRRTRAVMRRSRRWRTLADRFEVRVARYMIRRHQPDVVWANTVKAANFIEAARLEGVPAVLYLHELEPMLSRVLSRYGSAPTRSAYVVVCSPAIESRVREVDLPRSGLSCIPSPIDVAAIREADEQSGVATSDEPRIVLTVGTVDERKGDLLWADAVRSIIGQSKPGAVHCRWVGRVSRTNAIEATTDLDAVDFTGEVADVYDHLAEASVVLHPALSDPFPLAVLEAMAAGKPVVAFDLPGTSAQLGSAGVLVNIGDVEGLSNGVLELLADRSLATAHADAARERVIRFDVASFASAVKDVTVATVEAGWGATWSR